MNIMVDLLEDKDGNVLDIIEDTSELTEELTASVSSVSIGQGGTASDIQITGAVGALTAAIKDSSNATYAKLHAQISGDNDNVIIYADADAATGNYTVTLTDTDSKSTVIRVVVTS